MSDSIAQELAGIELGDQRLNSRSVRVLEAVAANPQASINAACAGWNDTLAAYRLFDNAAVSPEEILRPHRAATITRMQAHSVVVIAQDTTELDYSAHPPRDAQCLNTETRRGLYQHVELAVTPDRLCLGVVGVHSFDRAPASLGQKLERRRQADVPKESARWVHGYRSACELARACPETQVISVGDREADLYDLFVEAQQQQQEHEPSSASPRPAQPSPTAGRRADYLIRAHQDRSTPERNLAAGANVYHKVRDEVAQSPCRLTRSIDLPRTPQRAPRTALLEIRALTVTVKPPASRQARLPAITHNVVLAEEVGGPGDGTDVAWLLVTTLPIATADDLRQILDCYSLRWMVEVYFRTLKTGCKVEDLPLETKARLQNCLAFYHIIAWRVLFLTFVGRCAPDLPCPAVFTDAEWKSVWRVVQRKPLPKKPPSLTVFLPLLATLGGYNHRATEPPPGPQVLWQALHRMLNFAQAWQTFGPEAKPNCV
jgi:hypothetical protein